MSRAPVSRPRKEQSTTTRAFLFCDLRDYSGYVETKGDAAAARLLRDYRTLVRREVARHEGAEVKTEGDSFYVVFSHASRALECAVAILRAADSRNATSPEAPLRIGVGLHAGESVRYDNQFVGSAVNIASRLAGKAGGMELLISDTLRGLIRTSQTLRMTDRGALELKGVGEPIRAWTVDWREPGRDTLASAMPVAPESAAALPTERAAIPLKSDQLGATAGRFRRTIVLGVVAAMVAVAAVVALAVMLSPVSPRLVTVAGLGTPGFSGDGGPAVAAQLDTPISLAFDPAGNLYVADSSFFDAVGGRHDFFTRIRRIDAVGTIQTIAGDGAVDAPIGEFARAIRLTSETYLTADPGGDLYLAGKNLSGATAWVAKVSSGGFKIIAGGSSPVGYSGDGGPALKASLNLLRGLAVDSLGNVFVADSGNGRIRMVARDGIISTVAGNGDRGFSGDGGPATVATLFAPVGLAVSPDGSLYIADTNNHRVRRIDHSGNISTIAGNGVAGYGGDGGPARDAQLNLPLGLTFDRAGNLYIADSANNRVRKVDTSGVISTVAGDGAAEQLLMPSSVAVDPSGALYVADTGNHRIRKLVRS